MNITKTLCVNTCKLNEKYSSNNGSKRPSKYNKSFIRTALDELNLKKGYTVVYTREQIEEIQKHIDVDVKKCEFYYELRKRDN